jgi:capsular exopolysaccharide synthesis family protein
VLINIRAVSSDPAFAKKLADAWVQGLADEVARIEHPSGTSKSFTKLIPYQTATAPSAPISPNPRRNLEFGLLGGLALGLVYALIRFRLDRRIHGITDIAPYNITVAGVIPMDSSLSQKRGVSVENAVPGHPDRGLAGEAILKLRTNLQFMDIDDPPHTIVVTSPLPGDGKSTVAANLAVALAASERPVVIIDGDLRRPVQAESFGLVEGAGLTDVLIGRVSFEDVVQRPHGMDGVHLLAAGPVPPNPSELLGSRAMGRLLQTLAKTYTVIIDAPPLLPVTDAAVLTANADGALIVLSAGRSLDVHLAESLANIEQVNGHVLGVVLNKVKKGVRSGYYGYGYAYGSHAGVPVLSEDESKPAAPADDEPVVALDRPGSRPAPGMRTGQPTGASTAEKPTAPEWT